MTPQIFDCIVVGGGPAGLSAAIYLARYNRTVLVVDKGSGRSTTNELNQNYLGFPKGIESKKLCELGKKQARRFGAEFIKDTVIDIKRESDKFKTITEKDSLYSKSLIIATGVSDIFPEFENKEKLIGKSLFWCLTCDGIKTKGKTIIVLGNNDDTAVTCLQFLNFTSKIILITNRSKEEKIGISSENQQKLKSKNIQLIHSEIVSVLDRNGQIQKIYLGDGQKIKADYIFSHQGCIPNSNLARILDLEVDERGYIKTDNEQRTNIPLVYAAGDITKNFAHQIVTAAHEGATAATTANFDLYTKDQQGKS